MASQSNAPLAAIFLDRDGVINKNREGYVLSWEQVHFLPRSLSALRRLAQTSYAIVVVTNQSAIGRGLIRNEAAREINDRLISQIRLYKGRIDATYLCPHAPQDNCNCRKPKPGLLLQASQDLNLDLTRSWMIGDAITDLQAGIAADVQPILVRSGRGKTQEPLCAARGLGQVPVVNDLKAAVKYILSH